MYRSSIRTLYKRSYSRSVLSFIPNQDQHVFESEKLTVAENEAAVPNKPDVGPITKFHHEIENPEQIADLFIRARPTDILVTALADKSPILGNPALNWVGKSSNRKLMGTDLLFTNVSTAWLELFNKQIRKLKEISDDNTINFTVKSVIEYLDLQPLDTISAASLDKFFSDLKVFEKKQFRSLDVLDKDVASSITFDNTAKYLVSKDLSHTDLKVVLQYLSGHAEHFTAQGYTDFLIDLINTLHDSHTNHVLKSIVFNDFYSNSETVSREIKPHILDKLLNLLIHSGNLQGASEIISLMIDQHYTCPSVDNINLLVYTYESQLKNSGKTAVDIIRDMSNLKSVLFHIKMNEVVLEFFLKNTVRNIAELEHFVNLIGIEYVQKYQTELVAKLLSIPCDSKAEKELQVAQLLKRIINEGCISQGTVTELSEFYSGRNLEVLKHLQ